MNIELSPVTNIILETFGTQGVIDRRAFGHWALDDQDLKNLIEAIVRECADVCSNVLDYHAILEKFGVEQ